MFQYKSHPKTPLTDKQKADRSVSFGSEQAQRPHSVGRELGDLREDVNNAFQALELGTNIPEIHSSNIAPKASDNTIDGDAVIYGLNFLAGRLQATLTLNSLTFIQQQPGAATLSVAVVKAAGADAGMTAVLANNLLTITLGTAGGNLSAVKNTNTLIATAVNANAGIQATIASGQGAVSDLAIVSATTLAGGSGNGLKLYAYSPTGDVRDITSAIETISDTQIAVDTSADLVDVAGANQTWSFVIVSHTARSNVLNATSVA